MARTDRAPGPALKSSPPECGAATDTSAPCGFRAGPGKIAGRGPIGLLTAATALGQFLDRPLIDRTGLTGNFEVSLQWTPTPDQIPDRLRGNTSVDLRPTQLDIPSLFAALQEQLGLKLEPETAPIDVLVIDRIELPTAN